jgi:hypothetical protein
MYTFIMFAYIEISLRFRGGRHLVCVCVMLRQATTPTNSKPQDTHDRAEKIRKKRTFHS